MSRLDDIETFVAIVDEGSLSAASRRSGLALSAVSRRLKELEARLGGALLQRSTRRLNLTEAGRDYYLRCRRLLDDLAEADAAFRQSTGALSGRIRMTAPLSFAVLRLRETLNAFMTRHPGVEIEIDLNDRRVDVIGEGYDLALRIGQLEDSALVARRLCRIRHIPVAAPRLLAELGAPRAPEDLSRLPALRYRAGPKAASWGFERPDGTRGVVAMEGRFSCNNGDAVAAAAVAGLGVCLEPTFITAPHILNGALTPLFADHRWSDNAAYVVYSGDRPVTARVRALIDEIVAALAPEPSWDKELARRYALR